MYTDISDFLSNKTDYSTDSGNVTFNVVDDLNWTDNHNHNMHTGLSCTSWRDIQHTLFQLANVCFTIAFMSNNTKKGALYMHCWLSCGLLLICGWAWNIICAPDIFIWNIVFILINMGQIFYIIFQLRPVEFDPELEEVYRNLFQPFKIPRVQFKRMVGLEYAQIMSLHAGEAYAVQSLTPTDRLGLLLSGKVNVMISDNQYLHPILPCEFLDSPEFESSRNTADDKFNVSIVAASTCRYIFWQRCALEYLFVKEPYVATVLTTIVARDITTKLYAMNNKIFTKKGSHLDIRLPSITCNRTSAGVYKSPIRVKKKGQRNLFQHRQNHYCSFSKDAGAISELSLISNPIEPSLNDLSDDVKNWLETSSKYHSCELADND